VTRQGSDTGGAGSRTILFGGSGFLGEHILQNHPGIISVGRTPPRTANQHVQVDSLANLDILRSVDFDSVIFIIGNSDHYALEKEHLDRGEPTALDYHAMPLAQTLEQLKHFNIRKLVHFSTVLLYDTRRAQMPVSEDAPIDPYRNRYVLSKHIAEELCRFYSAWVPIINVRLSNLYGPTQLERYDLIHVLIRKLLANKEASVWTTKPRRDFTYVEDAAHAIVKLLDTDYAGDVNLGTGTSTRVAEIVELLRELSGKPIRDEDHEVNGPMELRCDTTRLESLIDWTPRYSTEAGVRRTWALMDQWSRE
jgi:nucleoside-diphosphate-sugar epimerase